MSYILDIGADPVTGKRGRQAGRFKTEAAAAEARSDALNRVSKMLGHSSISLTADTYSHLLGGVGQRAAEAADALTRAP